MAIRLALFSVILTLNGCNSGGSGGEPDGGAVAELPSTHPLLGAYLFLEDSNGKTPGEGAWSHLMVLPRGRLMLSAFNERAEIAFGVAGTYAVNGARITVAFEGLPLAATDLPFEFDGEILVLPFRVITSDRGDDGTSTWRKIAPPAAETEAERRFAVLRRAGVDAWYVMADRLLAGGRLAEGAEAAVAHLRGLADVASAEIDAEGTTINFTLASGLTGTVLVETLTDDEEGPLEVEQLKAGRSTARLGVAGRRARLEQPLVVPADRRALLVAPFANQVWCSSWKPSSCDFMRNFSNFPLEPIQAALEMAGYQVTVLKGGDARILRLREEIIRRYTVVAFITHGGFSEAREQSALVMGDTPAFRVWPAAGSEFREVVAFADEHPGEVGFVFNGPFVYTEVWPPFFTRARLESDTSYADSLVFATACSSDRNGSLRTDGFGTRFWAGYENTVSTQVAFTTMWRFFQVLAWAANTTGWEAFTDARGDVHQAFESVREATRTCPCTSRLVDCVDDSGCTDGRECDVEKGRCRCVRGSDCPEGQECALSGHCTDCPCRPSLDLDLWRVYAGDCQGHLEPLAEQLRWMLIESANTGVRVDDAAEARARCDAFEACLADFWSQGSSGGLANLMCHDYSPSGDPAEAVRVVNGLLCDDPPPRCEQFVLTGYAEGE